MDLRELLDQNAYNFDYSKLTPDEKAWIGEASALVSHAGDFMDAKELKLFKDNLAKIEIDELATMSPKMRALAILYLIGTGLHIFDLFDLRLNFSHMATDWKAWIVYLCFFDFAAAIGLWRQTRWGIAAFILVAFSQLVAYLFFQSFFGPQTFLVAFHFLTLATFAFLLLQNRGGSRSAVKEVL